MEDREFTRTMQLVRRAQEGDRDARERLFVRYEDRVRRHVRMRLGEKLRRDFDSTDILQDAFLVAIRRFEDFEMRDEASFLHWLRCIIEHQITDKVRWQRAKVRDHAREVAMRSGVSDSGRRIRAKEPASPATAPLDAIVRAEGRERVREVLATLDPKYRQILELRAQDGMSWQRIAARTGRPSADAARMMYAKALEELALRLGRDKSDASDD